MQQMASLGLLLTIFAGLEQVLCERGSAARNVVGDMQEKFTTTGGAAVHGHLFRQCANEAAAVEGSLYSIDVTESKSFVRAVLKEDQDVAWTDTGLEADQGVVQCAIKALEAGAEMYKYDGLCWAHLQGVSQDLLTTDCGAGDVVYVRKRCSPSEFECNDGVCVPDTDRCDYTENCAAGEDELDCGCSPSEFECNDGVCVPDTDRCDYTENCAAGEDELDCHNIFGGEKIPYGEYSGCFYSSPKGMTFGETSDRLVEEHLPSEKVTCCTSVEKGFCIYVDDIATQDINFCEAVARCEALGLSMLSIEIVNPEIRIFVSFLATIGNVSKTFPLNWVRDEQGVWVWMPSGATEPQPPLELEPPDDQNCILYQGNFLTVNCDDAVGYNSLCVEEDSQLPQCG